MKNITNWNSGNWNSGSYNSCNNETGFFNSKQSKTVRVFNTEIDVSVWVNCKKPNFIYFDLIEGKSY